MDKNNMVRTSVQIPESLFGKFKLECVKNKFNLRKLVERSMFLYITEENFKNSLHNILDTQITGSL